MTVIAGRFRAWNLPEVPCVDACSIEGHGIEDDGKVYISVLVCICCTSRKKLVVTEDAVEVDCGLA
jgi:hypothetical protein